METILYNIDVYGAILITLCCGHSKVIGRETAENGHFRLKVYRRQMFSFILHGTKKTIPTDIFAFHTFYADLSDSQNERTVMITLSTTDSNNYIALFYKY